MTDNKEPTLSKTERELQQALNRIGKQYNWDLDAFFRDVQKQLRAPKEMLRSAPKGARG